MYEHAHIIMHKYCIISLYAHMRSYVHVCGGLKHIIDKVDAV